MGRKPLKPHELRIVRKPKGAYVNYRGSAIYLGKWDWERGEPSPEAVNRFESLRALWRAEPDADLPESQSPLLLDVWADWRASPQGPRNRPEDLLRVQRLLFGNVAAPGPHLETRAADFRPGDFLDWQTSLCGPPQNYSRWTVGQCRRLVLACFDWASVKGLVDEFHPGALARVKPPSRGQVKEAAPRGPVSRQAVDAVTPHLTPPVQAVVELLWLTCARPSELTGLKAGDVRRTGTMMTPSGVLLDLDTLGVWIAQPGSHKTAGRGYERVLFFGPRAQAILAPWLEGRRATDYLFSPAEGRLYSDSIKRLTRGPDGTGSRKPVKGKAGMRRPGAKYTSASVAEAVAKGCVRAGVARWTPYQIRYSAFRLVQAEFGRDGARAFGGHKVGGATENYCGTDLRTAARIAAAIG